MPAGASRIPPAGGEAKEEKFSIHQRFKDIGSGKRSFLVITSPSVDLSQGTGRSRFIELFQLHQRIKKQAENGQVVESEVVV